MSALSEAIRLAPRFSALEAPPEPFDGEPPELDWLADALAGRPRAVLWRAARGIVAPLSYRRYEGLVDACARSAAEGWPVRLRRSGGGAVPQGEGVVNLSLAYVPGGAAGVQAEAVFAHLCGVLARALAAFGVAARPAEVAGSFCDGRFNLAVDGRKIAGTAQYWRRGGERQAVLAHALVVVDADPAGITAPLNRFEALLGSGRRYDAGVIASLAQACGARPSLEALRAALGAALDPP